MIRIPLSSLSSALAFFAASMLMPSMHAEEANSVLVHEGPRFTSPDDKGGDLEFTREFFASHDVWSRQKPHGELNYSNPLPVTAEKAIDLAKASAAADAPKEGIQIVKLELLNVAPEGGGRSHEKIYFYLIQMNVKGSEVHHVVLMDGTVIQSRLKQIRKP